MKRWSMMGMAACGLLAANAAYLTPWYVNPTPAEPVWLGVDEFTPSGLALGAGGTRLAVATEPSASYGNIRVYDLEDLVHTSGVALTNRHVTAFASSAAGLEGAPLLVANADDLIGIDAAGGAAAKFTFESRNWAGRYAPAARTFAAAPDATSFALDSTGALWSNATGAGRGGLLVKRTLSGTAYAEADTVDTGLAAVDAVAVYAVNGTAYAFAAAQGKVVRVNLATKAVATLVDDAAHLDAPAKSVKMSHLDYFRPRLYVLLATGDVAVYYLDKTATTATWSKTLTNAELLAAAQAPYAAGDAAIAAFEVTADGGTAFLAYKANEGATAAGPCRLAMVRHVAPSWRYYAANAAGNPSTNGTACITDGKWVLRCTLSGSQISLGLNPSINGDVIANRAWDGDTVHEYLDMSAGYATNASGGKYNITKNARWALGTNVLGRTPRVIIYSRNKSDYNTNQSLKGVQAEEVVLSSVASMTTVCGYLGLGKVNKRVVIDLPNLPTVNQLSFFQGGGDLWGAESDFGDLNLPNLATVHAQAFRQFDGTGILDLPSAALVSTNAFRQCRYMTEVRLGAEKKTLKALYSGAFAGPAAGGSLRRVTLGGAEGFAFKATNVFQYQPLEEVVFTGAVPEFSSSSAHWPDKAANTMTFVVPRGNPDWEAIMSDASKVTPLTEAERKAYRLANPGKKTPFGVVKKEVLRTAYDQYIAYDGGECRLTIDRDAFFDDAVEVAGDWGASSDGCYPSGATVTITARPGTTGVFRKWYGDVPRDDMDVRTNATLTLVLTNDVYLYARFVHPWTLAPDRKTASNGNFTINCSVVSESARTLKVGKDNVSCSIYAADDVGQGILDLGGPVRLEGDAAEWKFVNMPGGYAAWTAPMTANVTGLITPGTITKNLWGQILHTFSGAKLYELIFLDEPAMGSTFAGWTTATQTLATKFILELPSLTGLTGNGTLWGIPMTESKFDWWNLDNVTRIDGGSLAGYSDTTKDGNWNFYAPASGTLSLPSMRGVNNPTSRGSPLIRMYNVEGISLGGKDKKTTVTNICDNAFQNDRSLKRLTLHAAADITVGAHPFTNGYTPGELVFTGPAPASEEALSNLLSYVTAAETKPVKVYASLYQGGWATAPYIDHAPTAAECAEAPGECVIGVYRGGAAAPSGKALVIYRKSRFDAPGTVMLLR